MAATNKIFDLVVAIAAERPFTVSRLSALTGMKFAEDPESSSAYFVVSRTEDVAASPIRLAEVRTPRTPQQGVGGIVVLRIGEKETVTKRDVIVRFGTSGTTQPSPPTMPPGAPVWMEYGTPWGKLRFGFAPDGDEKLTEIVLDAINTKP